MGQSKHSEDEIIKLGKKLIEELKLEYSANTLACWMVHYIAELIHNAENSTSESEKRKLQKECCEMILKLWSNKEFLPINKPLQNLQPILEILEVFKERNSIILPNWIEYKALPRNNPWASFVDIVKNNAEKIFNKSIEVNFNKNILFKDKQWLEEHREFLTDEEKKAIKHLDAMIGIKEDSGMDHDNIKYRSSEERFNYIFSELEELINEQKRELSKLKERLQ